ncbi:DUF3618 domain-containing protein [Dickeya fangzhongdai]|nr:DUF3618 domain-containing protein [Dickeya fangzhongdai]
MRVLAETVDVLAHHMHPAQLVQRQSCGLTA